ncbi:MAG TPA: response regulator [Candidatus Saccharimonadales bacterium]|nr:response regulator [Candidatus Saccharimonadales bacterium]
MPAKRVLVIEDDQWFLSLVKKTLEREKITVVTASNTIEGMVAINEMVPDVIILDFFMPGPNALVLLHELQSYGDTAKVPVILCTNNASDIPKDTLSAYGVVSTLDKTTMYPDDIAVAVRKAI